MDTIALIDLLLVAGANSCVQQGCCHLWYAFHTTQDRKFQFHPTATSFWYHLGQSRGQQLTQYAEWFTHLASSAGLGTCIFTWPCGRTKAHTIDIAAYLLLMALIWVSGWVCESSQIKMVHTMLRMLTMITCLSYSLHLNWLPSHES